MTGPKLAELADALHLGLLQISLKAREMIVVGQHGMARNSEEDKQGDDGRVSALTGRVRSETLRLEHFLKLL